jgi:hypothetical protein
MALSFQIYTDAALTTPLVGSLVITQNSDGSTPAVETQLFIGSTTVGRTLQASSDPGVDQIVLSVVDASPGSGHESAEIKLALTQGGLAGAVAGAALSVGTQILSEAPNVVSFFIQVDDATGVVGTATELSVSSNPLVES